MMAQPQAAAPSVPTMAQAAESMAQIQADSAALPVSAQNALAQAQSAASESAAQAAAGQPAAAAAAAAAAQAAMAQAQASMAMGQAGMPGAPGMTPGMTPGMGMMPGMAPSMGMDNPMSKGTGDRMDTKATAGANVGPGNGVTGTSGYQGLPERQREALLQAQKQRSPQEYNQAIEQYLRNLADYKAQEANKP